MQLWPHDLQCCNKKTASGGFCEVAGRGRKTIRSHGLGFEKTDFTRKGQAKGPGGGFGGLAGKTQTKRGRKLESRAFQL